MVPLRKLKDEILKPISFYMKEFDESFSMVRHVHPYIEVMYCQSEQFKFEVYEDKGNGEMAFSTYVISAGDIIIVDAMVPHCIITDSKVKTMIYNIEFEAVKKGSFNPYGTYDVLHIDYAKMFEKSGWKQIAESERGYMILPDTENVEHYFRMYLNALTGEMGGFEDVFAACARQIMFFAAIGKCKASNRTGGCVLYIKRAREYINKNYASNINIEEVADYAGVNKIYLQKLFRSYTGSTILKTINEVRVNKARQLLAETNMSLDLIYMQTGFHNRQHFIYAFKNIVGQTPSDYRKQNQYRFINYQALHVDSKPFVETGRTEIEMKY